jgi:uncharacterized radical SAM superfamily Fe-S cluster-containing enzyme
VTRDAETNGTSIPPLKIEDVDSAFIHECVGACNIRVLELQEAQMEKALLLLCLKCFLRTREIPPEELEIEAFRKVLKVFVLKGMLFERAMQKVGGERSQSLDSKTRNLSRISARP